MKRDLFDIWEDPKSIRPERPWRVQLVNYVGHFMNREQAELFVASTKRWRAAAAKSVTKSK